MFVARNYISTVELTTFLLGYTYKNGISETPLTGNLSYSLYFKFRIKFIDPRNNKQNKNQTLNSYKTLDLKAIFSLSQI